MIKCPHCEYESDSMQYECRTEGWECGTFFIDSTGDPSWDYDDSGTDDCLNYVYLCHSCGGTITEDGNEAEILLKNSLVDKKKRELKEKMGKFEL